MPSRVTEFAAASPGEIAARYARRLAFETDCSDVCEAMRAGVVDFVLLDVRGPAAYEKAHVPGAVNVPARKLSQPSLAEFPPEALFVVYCAGPHCNGADKAALRLAQLDRRVKVMLGGMTGWADEGYAFAHGATPGAVIEPA